MAKVIIKTATDNSKNRRFKARGELMAKRKQEAKELERLEEEKKKNEAGIDGVSDAVAKAILSPSPPKDISPPNGKKDDAMNYKVNHAHQRRPGKKWS